jgi:hypothetical protein
MTEELTAFQCPYCAWKYLAPEKVFAGANAQKRVQQHMSTHFPESETRKMKRRRLISQR